MKTLRKCYGVFAILAFCALSLQAQNTLASSDKRIISDFEKRTKKYSDLRESRRRSLPKVSENATPEQIEAHKIAFQKSIQSARINAKQGDIFTPAAARHIRAVIKSEFKGFEGTELRKTVLEADTTGVPLKINFPYPESKELVEMSPALLLSLPQLPKPLRYRYIGRSLAILDRDNSLIIDFMTDALP